MYKLVISDLDGTLLSGNKTISDANLKAVSDLHDAGIKFSIATGRIYSSARTVAESIGLSSPIIACNGAVIYDVANEKIMYDAPISKEICRKILKVLRKYDIYFHFYSLETVYGERNERLVKQYKAWAQESKGKEIVKIQVVPDVGEIIEKDDVRIYKFGFYNDDEVSQTVFDELSQIEGLELYYSVGSLVDVMNIEASKGNALKKLAESYDIPLSQVVAIGDNENDLPMIQNAGLGIGMGNGREVVKAHANYVTETSDLDGFANAMNLKVLNK